MYLYFVTICAYILLPYVPIFYFLMCLYFVNLFVYFCYLMYLYFVALYAYILLPYVPIFYFLMCLYFLTLFFYVFCYLMCLCFLLPYVPMFCCVMFAIPCLLLDSMLSSQLI